MGQDTVIVTLTRQEADALMAGRATLGFVTAPFPGAAHGLTKKKRKKSITQKTEGYDKD